MSVFQNAPAETPAVGQPPARERVIPTLNDGELKHEVYARSTCWEAGFLVSKNAGWRNIRPAIDQTACTRCLNCYLYCPDGTIYKVADSEVDGKPEVAVDYDFCKGCGICARVCPAGCLTMIAESEA